MQSKAISDYERLVDNDFFKLYTAELSRYQDRLYDSLKNYPLDKIAKAQGELMAIEWALNRPKSLFEELTKEAK
jgi:hypothetical protein